MAIHNVIHPNKVPRALEEKHQHNLTGPPPPPQGSSELQELMLVFKSKKRLILSVEAKRTWLLLQAGSYKLQLF